MRGRPDGDSGHRLVWLPRPGGSLLPRAQAARLGAAEDAVALLKSATAAGFCCYPLLVSDEWLDPVPSGPEFADVLAQVKREHELAAAAFAAAGGDRILDVRSSA